MSSRKIEVIVRSNSVQVGTRHNAPVRKRPDGYAGIVINGWVYPLAEDHSVELTDDPVSKDECVGFFEDGDDLIYFDGEDDGAWWHFERTTRASYIAFDGSPSLAEAISRTFVDANLTTGVRESFRPASDGKFYDYYIKMPIDVDERKTRYLIKNVVLSSKNGLPVDTENSSSEESARQLLYSRIQDILNESNENKKKIEQELANAREELKSLRAEQSHIRSAWSEERQELLLETDRLQAEIRRLKRAVETRYETIQVDRTISGDSQSVRIATLQQQIEARDRKVDELTRKLEHAHEEGKELLNDLVILEDQNSNLKIQLDAANSEAARSTIFSIDYASPRREEKRILYEMMEGAFPRLELRDSDRKNMLREFGSIVDCTRILSLLHEEKKIDRVKSLSGYNGVFEIFDIKTGVRGREQMGRIYYRQEDDGRLSVRIQVKKDEKSQNDFIKNMF